jgi:surfactin synthase thioesterase subunit
VRLVAFAHSASGPNALLPLLCLLPPDVELIGVTLPGRERRFGEPYEHMLTDPGVVAREVCGELEDMHPLPLALFGHSLGASLAAAVALELPGTCRALVLSATPLTGRPDGQAAIETEEDLLDVVVRGGGTPEELLAEESLRAHILGLLRADLRLGELVAQANLGRRLPVSPLVLGGSEDQLVAPAEMVAVAEAHGVAGGPVFLPGGHFYLLDERNRSTVAQLLLDAMDGNRRGGTTGAGHRAELVQ